MVVAARDPADGDGLERREPLRSRGGGGGEAELAALAVAACEHRTRPAEEERVRKPGGDGDDARAEQLRHQRRRLEARRAVVLVVAEAELAPRVAAAGEDAAARGAHQRVPRAARDTGDALPARVDARRLCAPSPVAEPELAVRVLPPTPQDAAPIKRQRMGAAARDEPHPDAVGHRSQRPRRQPLDLVADAELAEPVPPESEDQAR